MKSLATDRLAGVVLLLFGAWYAYTASGLTSSFPTDVLGPGTFPLILGLLLVILSIFLIVKPGPNADWPEMAGWIKMGLVILSFIIYAYIMEPLGYIIATSLEMIALSLIFKGPPLKTVIASIIFSVLMFVLFKNILDLRLPIGDIFEGFIG